MAEDAKQFAQRLAEKALARIRDGMTGDETAALFRQEVANAAREMEAGGKSGKEIAEWVEAVSEIYSKRMDELTGLT